MQFPSPHRMAHLSTTCRWRLLAALFLVATALFGQDAAWNREHYTKYEYQVPVRDGVRLFTAVYVPKDASKSYPILLTRTPYSCSPYGADNYRERLGPAPEIYAKEGFIFACQDVRGRYLSEGDFVHVRPHIPGKQGKQIDESSDTYDSIEWLIKNVQPNNGKVGLYGVSYPGFYTAMGLIDPHPALAAASPQAPVSDWFAGDDWHHNGAFLLQHAFRFLANFGRPRPEPTAKAAPDFEFPSADGYRFYLRMGAMPEANAKFFKSEIPFWNELMEQESYNAFWKARNINPHLKGVRTPTLTVGGWFDAENLYGALEVYRSAERQSPGAWNKIVMGPWYHGQWARDDGEKLGDASFAAKTSLHYRNEIEFPFFMHFLKGAPDPELPEASLFETGTNRWRRFDRWPPEGSSPQRLYFHASGRLAFDAPSAAGEAFDEYVSDPSKPVPSVAKIEVGMSREHMTADQRFASTRPDVLVFETEPLSEDFTIAGPVTADLYLSTTGTDSDWIVKLIDVYPEDYPNPKPNPENVEMRGYQQLVRGNVIRGKFRNSLEKAEPFVPGRPEHVGFELNDTLHTFRRGHRVMVQVQSTWFPLINRNPQVFTNIFNAPESEYRKATQRIYRSASMPSSLVVQAEATRE
ncbi:MAG: CocE/NonD family hydrolase [Bryobacterales bacterium]|nr:CocE/NonD family hydrolase [Bryobacterales bacterium]